MQIQGIIETALHVDNVARSVDFYRDLLGLRPMIQDDRFCALDVNGRSVLLLFLKHGTLTPVRIPGGVIPPHGGEGELHFALSIDTASYAGWKQRIEAAGVSIESEVEWERGGKSLYFRDPDRHLVELVTPGCWPTY
jgi:catechol 2,3-dioxygenase-like lactoylglutathione lyase family enzyme